LFLASTLSWGANAAPAKPEAVGDMGGEARLVLEGNQTYSRNNIVKVLGGTLEFHVQSHPSAPLADYLAWIEKMVSRGYQHDGFAKVAVTVKADRAARQIRVRITEGPRFLCGEVKVSGLDKTLAEQLKGRLREAANTNITAQVPGAPVFYWSWQEGKPVPADAISLADLEHRVPEALAELNRHQAEVRVELSLNQRRRQADLLIQVKKPGMAGTLDQIEVTGLKANTRDELLAFLQLSPGMVMAGNVTNDVVRCLYDSGRFRGHAAKLSPLAKPGRFKLDIAVVENTDGPSLKQPLSAEQQALLKVREWVLQWPQRTEDWVLEAEVTKAGRHHRAEVVLSQAGLAIVHREALATNPPGLARALVATPGLMGLYSAPQQSKLVGRPKGGQLITFVELTSRPREDGSGGGNLTIGAGYTTASKGTPFVLRLDLAPAAFVGLPNQGDVVCAVEKGLLSIRSQTNAEDQTELIADAATGRLIRCSRVPGSKDGRLTLRCEQGALTRVLREVDTDSAAFTDGFEVQHLWSSGIAFIEREALGVLKQDFPKALDQLGPKFAGGLSSEEALGALAALEVLPWDQLLAPFDSSTSVLFQEKDEKDFPTVLDRPLPGAQAASDWMKMLGGVMLRANDNFWPRGSWPWAVGRDATFLASGKGGWVTNDVAQLAESGDIGPLGCLVAAQVFSRFDPRLAVPFAKQGVARTTAESLQNDLRVLLSGEQAVPQFLRGTLQRAPSLKEKDLRVFLKLLGTNSLPFILECYSALTISSNLPPDQALRPVVERHWERVIRPRLLTAFAEGCLTKSPAPAIATEAAGWLREAAEQGHAPAQMLLARLCRQGVGVAQNPAVAATWIRKAAEQNYPHAACELGRMYRDGIGVPRNQEEAARWFRREAEGGCTAAMFGLAAALLSRDGTSREDRDEAILWMRKAAELNCAAAQYYLGETTAKPGDMDEALRWYRKAARNESVEAQKRLGELLSDGLSLKPDYVEAWMWFKLAAEQGDRFAGTRVNSIEKKLTAEQFENAKRMLRDHSKGEAGAGESLLPTPFNPIPTPLSK
jgi:tetratricopeptide (TPR) repeat protein